MKYGNEMVFMNETVQAEFVEVTKFAAQVGAIDEFQNAICALKRWGDEGNLRVVLGNDFAPYSFTFGIERQTGDDTWDCVLNGGLIYSGPGCPSDGSFPTLTVSLDDDAATGSKHKWSIHT